MSLLQIHLGETEQKLSQGRLLVSPYAWKKVKILKSRSISLLYLRVVFSPSKWREQNSQYVSATWQRPKTRTALSSIRTNQTAWLSLFGLCGHVYTWQGGDGRIVRSQTWERRIHKEFLAWFSSRGLTRRDDKRVPLLSLQYHFHQW